MKNLKSVLALILSLAMIFCMVPFSAAAETAAGAAEDIYGLKEIGN